MPSAPTIILNCAGAGRRLGLGQTKALIDVLGRPLIHWQLDLLDDVADVRVVIGYNAASVIDVVLERRRDVSFVFNHAYAETATGDSLALAATYAADEVVSIDGDLLIRPSDMRALMASDGPLLGVTRPTSDQAVYVEVVEQGGALQAVEFVRDHSCDWEWTGLVRCPATMLIEAAQRRPGPHHVYQLLEQALPYRVLEVDTREIDTVEDYERALTWLGVEIAEGRWI